MKTKFHFLLAALLYLQVSTAHAAIPAGAQKEIDQLVQQDKFTAALAKVDALLKNQPTDKDLLDLKAQLQKSAPSASAAAAAPKLKGEDRLELATLNSIIDDIKAATDADGRKKLMQEFLDQSRGFIQKHPDQTNIWAMRASAALEVGDVDSGWAAGQKLKSLGALDSDDEQLMKVMASLKRKGWLADDLSAVKSASKEAKLAEMRSKLDPEQQKLIGDWKLARYQETPDCKTLKLSGSLRIALEDNGTIHIRGCASSERMSNDGTRSYDTFQIDDQSLQAGMLASNDGAKISARWRSGYDLSKLDDYTGGAVQLLGNNIFVKMFPDVPFGYIFQKE